MQTLPRLVLGWVTVFGRANHLSPATWANWASYSAGKCTVQSALTLRLGSKGTHGSFRMRINVWMAGKTVWSLVNTCRTVPERFRDEYRTALYKCPVYFTYLIPSISMPGTSYNLKIEIPFRYIRTSYIWARPSRCSTLLFLCPFA